MISEDFTLREKRTRHIFIITFLTRTSFWFFSSAFLGFPMCLLGMLAVTIYALITYNCSYKKKGSDWLAFVLIATPIINVIQGALAWDNFGSPHPQPFILVYSLTTIIEGFYLWSCWKLREINKHYSPITPCKSEGLEWLMNQRKL